MEDTNSKAKKITLEDFISKASAKHKNKKMEAEIEIEGYGLVPFRRPTDSEYLEYMNQLAKSVKADKEGNVIDTDLENMTDASAQLIYKTCTFLHNKDLQESLEVKDPLDSPAGAFGIDRLTDIAGKITDAFYEDGGKKVKDTIKN